MACNDINKLDTFSINILMRWPVSCSHGDQLVVYFFFSTSLSISLSLPLVTFKFNLNTICWVDHFSFSSSSLVEEEKMAECRRYELVLSPTSLATRIVLCADCLHMRVVPIPSHSFIYIYCFVLYG